MRPAAIDDPASVSPVVAFERLFENDFVTLEDVAISCRTAGGLDYLDERVALARSLEDPAAADDGIPGHPEIRDLHEAMHAAWDDVRAVVTGRPPELRALLVEGCGLPAATSPMINRGVPDLAPHLVAPEALVGSARAETLARARQRADADGMRHVLILASDGLVCAAGPTMHETMAHYSNVAFAARVECQRIEERLLQAP